MWYRLSISREEAENIIKRELESRTFTQPATSDILTLKKQLIEKYGSESEMIDAVNKEVNEIMSEFDQSSPWMRGSNETHTHFTQPYEAFYVMPNGQVTPNLRSHVRFDKFLLARLGINPSGIFDRSDEHLLSALTGAMRVNFHNVSGEKRRYVTIYNPPTQQQSEWLKQHDISSGDIEYRYSQESDEEIEKVDHYKKIMDLFRDMSLEEILSDGEYMISQVTGNIVAKYDKEYNIIFETNNPNSLPQEDLSKLINLYKTIRDADDFVQSLKSLLKKYLNELD